MISIVITTIKGLSVSLGLVKVFWEGVNVAIKTNSIVIIVTLIVGSVTAKKTLLIRMKGLEML